MSLSRLLLHTAALLPVLTLPAFADYDFTIEGRPYRLVTAEKNFANAQADAISKGGQLVHIDSQEENDAILAAIRTRVETGSKAADGGDARYAWIGGTEIAEGNYAWKDAEATAFWTGGKEGAVTGGGYANWGRNTAGVSGPEPDNTGNNQTRVAMAVQEWPTAGTARVGQPGQWNDLRETNVLDYVIEFSGIYATFVMSHNGVNKPPFTAKLHFDKVPLTVGNFMGLAEGTKDFIDEKNGFVTRRPYYNGLTSHRIIKNFMFQAGCPRGTGTGGPGYSFLDEFHSTLRHNKAGILSMANSGGNTNGSQFFVTVATAAHLDDKHSVFGEVISGYNETVKPLSEVPVEASTNKPTQPVKIESITFHRAGTAAREFNTAQANLPLVTGLVLVQPSVATGHCILNYPRLQHCAYELLLTEAFQTWKLSDDSLSVETFGPVADAAVDTFSLVPANAKSQFFRVAQVQYPYPVYAPMVMTGKKVTVVDPTLATFIHNLTTVENGDYKVPLSSGDLTGEIRKYVWERTPHGARFVCPIGGTLLIGGTPVHYLNYALRFTSATGGTMTGSLQSTTGADITRMSGTFTTGDLP